MREDEDDSLGGSVTRFLGDERGLETIEYALIMGLVSAGMIAVVAAIGVWVSGSFQQVSGTLDDADVE